VPDDPNQGCFACGSANPIGLRLCFAYGDGSAEACFIPETVHQGYPGLLHGGLVATLLDEAMAHAVVHSFGPAVTGELHVRLRGRGVLLGQPVVVRGRIVEHRGRYIRAKAELVGSDGALLACGEGKFMRVELGAEKPEAQNEGPAFSGAAAGRSG